MNHLQHIQHVSFKAHASAKHMLPTLVFTSKFLAKSADFAGSGVKCCNGQSLFHFSMKYY